MVPTKNTLVYAEPVCIVFIYYLLSSVYSCYLCISAQSTPSPPSPLRLRGSSLPLFLSLYLFIIIFMHYVLYHRRIILPFACEANRQTYTHFLVILVSYLIHFIDIPS